MTNEEKTILIAYLVDAGELDPKATWKPSSRTGTGSARAWYPERRTTRPSSMPPGRGSGASRKDTELAWPRARRRWAGTSWKPPPGFTASWTTSTRRRTDLRDPGSESTSGPRPGRSGLVISPRHSGVRTPERSGLGPFWQERAPTRRMTP